MASTYSPSLRLELMGHGDKVGSWGDVVNKNFGDLLEQSIAGVGEIDVTSGDVTLSANDGALDEARNAILRFVGTPSSDLTVTLPDVSKLYILDNHTDVNVTLLSYGHAGVLSPKSLSRCVVYTGGIKLFLITDAIADILYKQQAGDFRSETGLAALKDEDFTGTPRAPQPADNDHSTQVATTAFVKKFAMPAKTIIMWSGSYANIPDGWKLCDGSNNTPDLRDRMVLGVNNKYPLNSTGGTKDVVLVEHDHGGKTGGQSNSHTHSGNTNNAGAHTHGGVMAGNYTADDNGTRIETGRRNGSTASAGEHTHTLTTGNSSSDHTHNITPSGNGNGTGRNLPPYYKLAFLMKE